MNIVYGLLSFTDSIDLFERQRDPGFTITCVEIKISRRIHDCSMAWRCRFLTARPCQDGHVIAENDLVKNCRAPDALVDFHTDESCPKFK